MDVTHLDAIALKAEKAFVGEVELFGDRGGRFRHDQGQGDRLPTDPAHGPGTDCPAHQYHGHDPPKPPQQQLLWAGFGPQLRF